MADEVLIATFEEVISDFGQVVRRCNARFKTEFTPYERTDLSEGIVADTIDQRALAQFGPDDLARVRARPSPPRLPAEVFLEGVGAKINAQFDELDRLYDRVASHR
jgi:hypothetical protein